MMKIEKKVEEMEKNVNKELTKSKKNENSDAKIPISVSKLSITELMHYKEACLMLVEFYAQEYKITETRSNAEEIERNNEARNKNKNYNILFIKFVSEIEKRVNELCFE